MMKYTRYRMRHFSPSNTFICSVNMMTFHECWKKNSRNKHVNFYWNDGTCPMLACAINVKCLLWIYWDRFIKIILSEIIFYVTYNTSMEVPGVWLHFTGLLSLVTSLVTLQYFKNLQLITACKLSLISLPQTLHKHNMIKAKLFFSCVGILLETPMYNFPLHHFSRKKLRIL